MTDAPRLTSLAHGGGCGCKLDPAVLRQLLESPRLAELPPDALAGISSGGAPVPPDLIRSIETQFESKVSPANGYGLTETTSAVIINSGADYFTHPDSVGRAAVGTDVRIVDEHGGELPPGERGIIGVRQPSPCTMIEYWRNPEATAKKYAGEFLLTGDLGVQDEDGYLWYVSREDDVITSAGYRIGPSEMRPAARRSAGRPAPTPAA